MTISQIANLMSIPIGSICLFISIRAFYIYVLSSNEMIFILGLSMAFISIGTFAGTFGEAHIAGNHFSTEWTRAFGACSGGLFIFLSSLVKSHGQMQKLRRWQVITAMIFCVVIFLTPLYPPISPLQLAALNCCRMIIYSCAFARYAYLYSEKSTRFSFIMCLAFLVLVVGYGLNLPGYFHASFAPLTIGAAIIRMMAFLTLLVAYSGS